MPVQGDILENKYRLDRKIGAGGFATVWAAVNIRIDRHVALKILSESQFQKQGSVDRFIREAKFAALELHPTVVRVEDMGQTREKIPFLVMERLHGCTLEKELKSSGALPIPKCLEIAQLVLEGLATAHLEGIIHRDIKPANIFLVEPKTSHGPPVRILDMGIAKSMLETDPITVTDQFLGTPRYLAPEILLHPVPESWTTAVDVYAFGVVLFQALTGRLPFDLGEGSAIFAELIALNDFYRKLSNTGQEITGPARLIPELHPLLNRMIEHALAIQPGDRYRDASEMLAALIDALEEIEHAKEQATRAAAPIVLPPPQPTPPMPSPPKLATPRRPPRAPIAPSPRAATPPYEPAASAKSPQRRGSPSQTPIVTIGPSPRVASPALPSAVPTDNPEMPAPQSVETNLTPPSFDTVEGSSFESASPVKAPSTTLGWTTRAARAGSRRAALGIGIGVALLGLLVLGAFLVLRSPSEAPTPPSTVASMTPAPEEPAIEDRAESPTVSDTPLAPTAGDSTDEPSVPAQGSVIIWGDEPDEAVPEPAKTSPRREREAEHTPPSPEETTKTASPRLDEAEPFSTSIKVQLLGVPEPSRVTFGGDPVLGSWLYGKVGTSGLLVVNSSGYERYQKSVTLRQGMKALDLSGELRRPAPQKAATPEEPPAPPRLQLKTTLPGL